MCACVCVLVCVCVCRNAHLPSAFVCVLQSGCIGLVSQLPSFAALVKRGATLMRRETDSVSAAPDRVCGPLWMKLVQSVWCASAQRWTSLVTPVFGTLYTLICSPLCPAILLVFIVLTPYKPLLVECIVP